MNAGPIRPPTLTRRRLLGGAVGVAIAATLPGCFLGLARDAAAGGGAEGGELLGVLPFLDEGSEWRQLAGLAEGTLAEPHRYGSGLGGRQLLDLSNLDRSGLVTPAERFFVRTFKPEDLGDGRSWALALEGLVREPRRIPIDELRRRARPRGAHLLECSGNAAEHDFGLMSAARWSGVPALEVLDAVHPTSAAAAVEVTGFDQHLMPSVTSVPGASWIFTPAQLESTGAFFATAMNGAALTRDHGFPLRLVVPGWYGCTCIKWVTRARWVAADALSTAQMREFAARTQQDGVPDRALDFADPSIDAAAMPVRVELRRRGEGRELRLVGIVWGGRKPVRRLSLQAGPEAPWVSVEQLDPATNASTWRLWRHRLPQPPAGRLALRLRVDDPGARTRRLDKGYYARTVEVPMV